jgi:hypothetical protein
MGDWAKLFKNFIYRDVAFILGGSIVLASFAYCFGLFPLIDKANADVRFPLTLLLVALAYVVGYGVQDIAGVIRLSSTAVPYHPRWFGRSLYRRFTRSEWKAVDYAKAPFEEFEIEMGLWTIPERTLQALDRIVSLKVVSVCIGTCASLSAVFILIHWFRLGMQSRLDLVLFIAAALFGLVLICLGWLKAMQEMQFCQAMKNKGYPGASNATD